MADMQALAEGLKVFALNGKAALVIGAEHPIGRVAAITLAEAGAKVLIASQNAGKSSGLRLVSRLPSSTVSRSTHLAPAFVRSVRSDRHDVISRPPTTSASAKSQGP